MRRFTNILPVLNSSDLNGPGNQWLIKPARANRAGLTVADLLRLSSFDLPLPSLNGKMFALHKVQKYHEKKAVNTSGCSVHFLEGEAEDISPVSAGGR